jgi:hypothetical protein
MKSILLAPFFAFAVAATAVAAEPIRIDVPTNVEPEESGLTRAEVVADFHLWRLAGLHALNQGEQSADTTSYEYRRAYAIYAQLRASPQYAALVSQLRQNPHASVRASRTADRLARAGN